MLDIVLEQNSKDDLHWMLQDQAQMSFDNIAITMDNSFVNTLVSYLNWVIKYFIKSQEKSIVKLVDDEIAKLNDIVLHEQAYTFDVNLI